MGKIRRKALIRRREAHFDALVSGYSVEQIATIPRPLSLVLLAFGLPNPID